MFISWSWSTYHQPVRAEAHIIHQLELNHTWSTSLSLNTHGPPVRAKANLCSPFGVKTNFCSPVRLKLERQVPEKNQDPQGGVQDYSPDLTGLFAELTRMENTIQAGGLGITKHQINSITAEMHGITRSVVAYALNPGQRQANDIIKHGILTETKIYEKATAAYFLLWSQGKSWGDGIEHWTRCHLDSQRQWRCWQKFDYEVLSTHSERSQEWCDLLSSATNKSC